MDLKTIFSKIQNPEFYVIDIGASFGVETDPLFPFITNNKFKGLCIEGNSTKVTKLKTVTNFDIHCGYITPLNAIDIFQRYGVPSTFDILKIDIDGYDLEVLRSILKIYKPKIIIAEINEKIPPPICFEVKYKHDYSWDESHFFGFSVQSAAQLMNTNNYKILSIYDLNNIVCIDTELCGVLQIENTNSEEYVKALYKEGYIDRLERLHILPWNEGVNYWLNINNKEILKEEITNYFVYNNNRSRFEIKTKIKDIDFHIE